MRLVLAATTTAAALAAAAFSFPAQARADELIIKGEALMTKNCERCHALHATGDSKHPQAPPLRQIVTRYPLDDLAEGLAEGLVTGHPDMPEFVFAPSDIDAILAYLGDLKAKTNGDAPKPEEPK